MKWLQQMDTPSALHQKYIHFYFLGIQWASLSSRTPEHVMYIDTIIFFGFRIASWKVFYLASLGRLTAILSQPYVYSRAVLEHQTSSF
jgi:hypothetical protein